MPHTNFSIFERGHGKSSFMPVRGAGQFFVLLCNMANFLFEWDHGKLSVCIMANVVYGAWQIFFLFCSMANFLFSMGPWQSQCIFHGNGSSCSMANFLPSFTTLQILFSNRTMANLVCVSWQMQFLEHGNFQF